MNKKNSMVVRGTPSYWNYFQFRKEEDSKALAKAVIKGELDFSDDDKRLDKMLFSILSKTEKYKVKCFNEAKKRKNFAQTSIPKACSTAFNTEASFQNEIEENLGEDDDDSMIQDESLMLPSISREQKSRQSPFKRGGGDSYDNSNIKVLN
jgi:hypothetical protein